MNWALICGEISILCWIIVFTPQLIENYKRQSGEGLSILFLCIWLVGDIFSAVGAVIENLLPTIIWLGVYHAFATLTLILQVLYYRYCNQRNSLQEEFQRLVDDLPDRVGHGTVRYHDEEPGLLENVHWRYQYMAPMIVVFGLFMFGLYTLVMLKFLPPSMYMGYTSAILYVSSRIPQIVKNVQTSSVQGLSFWLFFVGIIGNTTYCMSILIESLEPDHLLRNLPWFLGSSVTLLLDMFIGLQFWIYREREQNDV